MDWAASSLSSPRRAFLFSLPFFLRWVLLLGPYFWSLRRSIFHSFIYLSFNMDGSCPVSGQGIPFKTFLVRLSLVKNTHQKPTIKTTNCDGAAGTPPELKPPRVIGSPLSAYLTISVLRCLYFCRGSHTSHSETAGKDSQSRGSQDGHRKRIRLYSSQFQGCPDKCGHGKVISSTGGVMCHTRRPRTLGWQPSPFGTLSHLLSTKLER